jgi:hypothetical protein
MKWCFLINNAPFLSEFFGKLSSEAIKGGDECLIVWSSKIAEYEKRKFFPDKAKFISAVDWCVSNYEGGKKEFFGLSWKDFFAFFDRNKILKFNYEKSIGITLQASQFFEFIFEKEKPDVIINEPPTGLLHKVASRFCERNNVPYLGFGGSRIDGRIDIYDLGFICQKYESTFQKLTNSDISKEEREFAEKYIEDVVSHKQVPSYMGFTKIHFSQLGLLMHYVKRIKESGSPLFRYLRKRKYFKNFDYESESRFKNAISSPFKTERRKFRILLQKNIFSKIGEQDKDFFLFPLQFQPEASTNICATYYCDQLNSIKNIAFSLPFPCKLYVKEHPVAVGTRQNSFYRELKKIPNVVLISPYENIEKVIKNSLGVITLTSTVGMESALAGKPTYVFGDVFYSYHPLCRRLKNFDDLKTKIEEDLINSPRTDNFQDVNVRFVISYFRNTIEGDMGSVITGKDKNNYKLIYQRIIEILNTKNIF